MKRKIVVFLLLVLMAGVLFIGCNRQQQSEVTLMFWDDLVESDFRVLVTEFERANPELSVELSLTPWNEYWTRLATALPTNAAPDIFWINYGNAAVYMPTGVMMNLEPWAADIRFENFSPNFYEAYTFQGNRYAVPFMWDSIVLFYNKAHFDRAGLPYPDGTWDWDRFFDVARQLTIRSGNNTTQYGVLIESGYQTGIGNFILQNNGAIFTPDKMRGALDSPQNRQTFQTVLDMINNGYAPSQQTMMEAGGGTNLFTSGIISMMPHLSIRVSFLAEGLGQDLRIAPLPQQQRQATVIHNIAFAAAANTQNADGTRALISFLASRRTAEVTSNTFAPCFTGMSDMYFERFGWTGADYIPLSVRYGVAGANIPARNAAAVGSVIGDGFSRIFSNAGQIGNQLAELDAMITAEIAR